MKQNNLKSSIRKFTPQKRRAVAEVISSLLLVAITVVGAVILTTFLDESFVSGGLAASSSDSTIKTVKLIAFDTRDGSDLLGFDDLDNTTPTDLILCRDSCVADPDKLPNSGGTEFLVIQIENRSVNPIFLHNVYLDNVDHTWDSSTAGVTLDGSGVPGPGNYPDDGTFSILPVNAGTIQSQDNQLKSGQQVNLLIKLDSSHPDIPLSKTIRAQLNIGDNQLSEFLIESGGAQ